MTCEMSGYYTNNAKKAGDNMLLLKNASLIDGKAEKIILNQDILIEKNKIKEVSGSKGIQHVTGEVEVLDCSDKYVMPGMVDAHVHLIYKDLRDPYSIELEKSLEEAMADALLTSKELLSYGITTIRDVGTRGRISTVVRDLVKQGKFPGPNIVASSRIISTPGGMCDYQPSHIFGENKYAFGLGELILGTDQARGAVRRMVKDGAEFIKIECSGTGFNPFCQAHVNTLSYDEIEAIVNEAKQNNLYVACHAESYDSIKKAAKACVHDIQHGVFIDDEGVDLMLKNNVWLVPTLAMYWAFIEKGPEMGLPQSIIDGHLRSHEFHVKSIQKCLDAGIKIAGGSDSGGIHFPQGGIREEATRYVEIGMSPMSAIKAITVDGACCIGLGDSVGTIEAEKVADIIILNKNPLKDINVLKDESNLYLVLKGGMPVRGSL